MSKKEFHDCNNYTAVVLIANLTRVVYYIMNIIRF